MQTSPPQFLAREAKIDPVSFLWPFPLCVELADGRTEPPEGRFGSYLWAGSAWSRKLVFPESLDRREQSTRGTARRSMKVFLPFLGDFSAIVLSRNQEHILDFVCSATNSCEGL